MMKLCRCTGGRMHPLAAMVRFYRCPGCRLSPCARHSEGSGERAHGGHVRLRVGALEGSGQGLSGCAQVCVVSHPAAEERLSLEA